MANHLLKKIHHSNNFIKEQKKMNLILDNKISYEGNWYYDERMYLLHLFYGKTEYVSKGLQVIEEFLGTPKKQFILWTRCNYGSRAVIKSDSFLDRDEAIEYLKLVEPQTPLISLNGLPMKEILSYDDYCLWLNELNYEKSWIEL